MTHQGLVLGFVLAGNLLVASAADAAQATVSWAHDGVNVTAFNIDRKPAGGAYARIGAVPAGTYSYLDPTNLTPGDYCWRVSGENGPATPGPPSGDTCVTVTASPPNTPTAPTTVSVTITVTPGAQGAPAGRTSTPPQPAPPKPPVKK
jgi:hypothetical protein